MERRKDIYEEFNDKFWTTFWVSQPFLVKTNFGKIQIFVFNGPTFWQVKTFLVENNFWVNPDIGIQLSDLLFVYLLKEHS